jgi:hypothetical protein
MQSALPQREKLPVAEDSAVKPARTSRWIVAVLCVWLVTDVLSRALPLEWLNILPEHIATRRPGMYAPFIPNLRLHYDPWVGETALTGNLSPTETRSPVEFSTDSLGFRLTPGVPPNGKADLLLSSGASFAYGGGLSDDETFASVVSRESGLRMYNGGHFFWDLQGLDALDWLLGKLNHQHPALVLLEWEQAEHEISNLVGLPWKTDRAGMALLGTDRYQQVRRDVQYARVYLNAVLNISPLEVLSIRAFKSLCNDQILPNRYRQAVVERAMPNGKRILFLRDEVVRTLHPPDNRYVQRRAEYFDFYARELAKRNLQVYVILIPNRYTLYGPLLDNYRPSEPRYLDRLEAALKEKHVPVLNTLPMLESHAREDIAAGNMSFYREDHHWSAEGVRRVAGAFVQKLKDGGF